MKHSNFHRLAAALAAFMLAFPQTALAADYTLYADSLKNLGVFYGTENGYELSRAPTRAEGVAMVVRLLGAEDEAQNNMSASLPFTDVPDWARGYVSYAYHTGLTAGVSTTQFGAESSMSAQMFVAFLLRSLGYAEAEGDFNYAHALTFAQSIGLIDEALFSELSSSTFTRGHAVRLSYAALKLPVQNSDALLAESLSAQGKLNQNLVNQFIENVITDAGSGASSVKPAGQPLTVAEVAERKESVVLLYCTVPGGTSQGSGIIVSADGLIVTNYHVVDGASAIKVLYDDGTSYTGTVTVEDYDADLDLALLKINSSGLPAATLGDSDSLRLGEQIVAIGNPYGLAGTVSDGIISSIRENELQITAAISSGSSGGALFNMKGEVVGVTYAGISEGENLGFAIPINKLSTLNQRRGLSLSEFSKETAVKNIPQNLRLAGRENGGIYLQWDEVSGADYYLVYYRTENANRYTLCTNRGVVSRFTHGDNYSAALSGLQSGVRYQFVVTSVTGGVQSSPSAALNISG